MFNICRLCLDDIPKTTELTYNNYSLFDTKINLLMPEININATSKFTVCDQCSKSLDDAYNFKCQCLQIEELICNYVNQTKAPLLDLKDVKDYKFSLKESVTKDQIKNENPYENTDNEDLNETEHGNFDPLSFTSNETICITNEYESNNSKLELKTEQDEKKELIDKLSLKTFQCKICKRSYEQSSRLRKHHRVHSKTFTCDICNKILLNRSNLERHKVIHINGGRRFICDICKKAFKQAYELKKHKKIHNTKTYICSICSKLFRNLERHMAKTHLSKHICDICGLKCSTKHGLIDHIRTHTGDRPFKCEMCGKGFAQRGTLGVHIRSIHKNERPYACEICGKAFATKGKLGKHKVVHMTNLEKKFVCEATGCDKAFSTKIAKHRHMKRHTAERKHKCTVCEKAFTTGAALKRHLRCHTGEKPYECATCHKGFTQKYNLQIHFKSHRPKTSKL